MSTFSALAFWAITLFLTVAGLIHLFNEHSEQFITALGLVFAAVCFLIAAAIKS